MPPVELRKRSLALVRALWLMRLWISMMLGSPALRKNSAKKPAARAVVQNTMILYSGNTVPSLITCMHGRHA